MEHEQWSSMDFEDGILYSCVLRALTALVLATYEHAIAKDDTTT